MIDILLAGSATGRMAPSRRSALLRLLAAAAAAPGFAATGGNVFAQVRIDVSGVGASQYPIAIAGFTVDGGPTSQDVVAIVRSDLERSGAFRVIDPKVTLGETASVNFPEIRAAGADAIVTGSVMRLADGRYDIRYRLSDVVKQNLIGGESLVVGRDDLRYAGHRVADYIYEKLTGIKGIFSTRIAFISKQGPRYRLHIADWDGENIQTPLTSPEPIISPVWSPDGGRLAYVSFESRKPVVYVHTLSNGQRMPVANFKGSNSAPAWSPDGTRLAVALTRDGLSQLYMIDARGGDTSPRRLTSSSSIDTEPNFSPDGKSIYFTSDRGGSPQIYRIGADGGDASRVTFNSSYSVSPRVSPDGKLLAYISRRDGRYLVSVKDLASGNEDVLSENGREEAPSFAPNGKWVLYATQAGGRDILIAVTTDGRVKQRLTSTLGDIREPTWGPFGK